MRRRLVTRAFVVTATGGAIALAVSVGQASPARGGTATFCPTLRNVIGFDGQVSMSVSAGATGTKQAGGSLSVLFQRGAGNVRLHLTEKTHHGYFYKFGGIARGGTVGVVDHYEDSGFDYVGDLRYNQPLSPDSAEPVLVIDHISCVYKFGIAFAIEADYTGDPEVDYGHLVSFGATSNDGHVPESLTLHDSETLDTYTDCENALDSVAGCAAISGGWTPDLLLLFECSSDNANGCLNDENPKLLSSASFSYTLTPIYEKKKKPKKKK